MIELRLCCRATIHDYETYVQPSMGAELRCRHCGARLLYHGAPTGLPTLPAWRIEQNGHPSS